MKFESRILFAAQLASLMEDQARYIRPGRAFNFHAQQTIDAYDSFSRSIPASPMT